MAIVYSLSLIERKILKYAQVLYYKDSNIPDINKVKADIYQELKTSNLLKYLNISEQQQELTCMVLFGELKSRNQQNNHLFTMQAELMYIDDIIVKLSSNRNKQALFSCIKLIKSLYTKRSINSLCKLRVYTKLLTDRA